MIPATRQVSHKNGTRRVAPTERLVSNDRGDLYAARFWTDFVEFQLRGTRRADGSLRRRRGPWISMPWGPLVDRATLVAAGLTMPVRRGRKSGLLRSATGGNR